MFIEKWLEAKGYSDYELAGMGPWRRQHMCDYVNAFDFSSVSIIADLSGTLKLIDS
jgi:phospholipase C